MVVVDVSAIRSVYQPLVHLGTRSVVGVEALARGAAGTVHASPVALLAAAREQGRLDEVEWACRAAALRGAIDGGLDPRTMLFVNAEPEVAGRPPRHLWPLLVRAADELRVVVELTERSLAWQPARLLRVVGWVRRMGWGLAVDDVGVDPASLALVPLLRPDVVKLDMGLVHGRPDAAVAHVVSAVSAYAERTGATVVAEGIETSDHLATALGMGATVGQGWMLGRPGPLPAAGGADEPAPRPVVHLTAPAAPADRGGVFDLVARDLPSQRAPKPLLQAMSRHLEHQALSCGPATVLLSTVEDVRYLTPRTAARYQHVASVAALVAVLGTRMPVAPVDGVRGGLLQPDDPLASEWVVAVVAPHFAAALVARDLHDDGPDAERRFDHVLTYDRELVLRVASALLRRVPGGGRAGGPEGRPVAAVADPPATTPVGGEAARHLRSAFDNAPIGMAVLTAAGVVVRCNGALERLLGRPAAQLVGGDLFGVTHEDDRVAAHAACAALAASATTTQHVRLLHADGTVVPVTVTTSRVEATAEEDVHLVMHLQDARAQRALERELTHRASHDALTGLPHRALFLERLEQSLARAARPGRATAVLFLDLDGFKAVNDAHGHHAGDLVLVETAHRLSAHLRPGDTAARWGGDEFTVLCEGADGVQAESIARRLAADVARPQRVGDVDVVVRAAVGVACSDEAPAGTDARTLVRRADDAMYLLKPARPVG